MYKQFKRFWFHCALLSFPLKKMKLSNLYMYYFLPLRCILQRSLIVVAIFQKPMTFLSWLKCARHLHNIKTCKKIWFFFSWRVWIVEKNWMHFVIIEGTVSPMQVQLKGDLKQTNFWYIFPWWSYSPCGVLSQWMIGRKTVNNFIAKIWIWGVGILIL